MSRSVSAPSSVTNTSPCWNGLIVPGSTLMYGSNFCTRTFSPRALSRRPSEAAVMPLPSDETTPPVTNTYFADVGVVTRISPDPCPCDDSRASTLAAPSDEARSALDRREERGAAEHPLELGTALVPLERLDPRVRGIVLELLDAEVPVGGGGDLRQMGDRDDLRAGGEAAQRVRDGVRRGA